jgi:aspartate 1-decarboxylase
MRRKLCRSKIHRATVTDADLNYEGSITIDPILLDAADIRAHEQVHVANINTGARFDTYAMPGKRGSGQVVVNGAAARLAAPGDIVIIFAWGSYDEDEIDRFRPHYIDVDETNQIRDDGRRST